MAYCCAACLHACANVCVCRQVGGHAYVHARVRRVPCVRAHVWSASPRPTASQLQAQRLQPTPRTFELLRQGFTECREHKALYRLPSEMQQVVAFVVGAAWQLDLALRTILDPNDGEAPSFILGSPFESFQINEDWGGEQSSVGK